MTAPPRNRYSLAFELAKPVARGQLGLAEAHAAIIANTVRDERTGALGPYKAFDVVRLQRFLLAGEVQRLATARNVASWRIKRLIAPMLAIRRPFNAVLAEAHGHNGDAGFPLSEDEVTDLVHAEAYLSLPRAGGARHAR